MRYGRGAKHIRKFLTRVASHQQRIRDYIFQILLILCVDKVTPYLVYAIEYEH